MSRKANAESSGKLQLSCSVAMLALFARFLIETDNCNNLDISEVIQFFAENFKTTHQQGISTQSLRSKYDKPQSIHVKLFQQWIKDGLSLSQMWEMRLYGRFRTIAPYGEVDD